MLLFSQISMLVYLDVYFWQLRYLGDLSWCWYLFPYQFFKQPAMESNKNTVSERESWSFKTTHLTLKKPLLNKASTLGVLTKARFWVYGLTKIRSCSFHTASLRKTYWNWHSQSALDITEQTTDWNKVEMWDFWEEYLSFKHVRTCSYLKAYCWFKYIKANRDKL